MNFNEIRKMASGMGIKTYRMKKADLVRGDSAGRRQYRVLRHRESRLLQ